MDHTGSSIAGRGRLSGLHVLVAEDQWLLADTIAVLLEEEGAQVIGPFPDTVSARGSLTTERVDVALVDMGLRDMFSDPLIKDLDAQQTPYAVITGFDYLPTNAFDGAIAVVRKPVNKAQLLQILVPLVGHASSE